MKFVFRVEVEMSRASGPFASREELGEIIEDALQGAEFGDAETDAGGAYYVEQWTVSGPYNPADKRDQQFHLIPRG